MIGIGNKREEQPASGAQSAPTIETSSDAIGSEATLKNPHALPSTDGANSIVRKWTAWSAGFGLIPIPFLDFATTTGFSLKMLYDLSKYYRVEFRAERGKSAIAALLGGASSPMVALTAGAALKSIPIVGIPLAVATGPLIAGGITYALGRVFTAHYGAGGTLFDFDPEKFREYFQEQVEAGKDFVKHKKAGAPAS